MEISHVSCQAPYLQSVILSEAVATDDTGRASDLVALLGALTIAALVVLDGKGFLRPNGDIPNIGYILSILIERGWEIGTPFAARSHCTSWVYRVIDMADKAGIELFGGRHFRKVLQAIRKNEPAGRTPYITRKWDVVNFTQRVSQTISMSILASAHTNCSFKITRGSIKRGYQAIYLSAVLQFRLVLVVRISTLHVCRTNKGGALFWNATLPPITSIPPLLSPTTRSRLVAAMSLIFLPRHERSLDQNMLESFIRFCEVS